MSPEAPDILSDSTGSPPSQGISLVVMGFPVKPITQPNHLSNRFVI
jgi:hypothetical protein